MATITKRKDSYRITVSCGYTSTGKQVRRSMTWTPAPQMTAKQIEKELNRQATLFEEKCHTGQFLGGNVKFQAFAEQWFTEYAQTRLKERTIDSYHRYEPRVYAAIGHLKMQDITTRMMQKFALNLGEDGINARTGGGLSPKSIKNYICFVSSVFDYAVSQGVVRENPCRGVILPKIEHAERDCYTLEEAQRFLSLLESEPLKWRAFFTLAIYGGFRRGELLGLEWDDIDFEHCTISINRTLNYTPGKGVYIDTPKTETSKRILKMPVAVIDVLQCWRSEQTQQRLKIGDQWQVSGYVFTSWNGLPAHPNSVETWLIRFCARSGMRYVNVHSFRHLNATLLINSGADVKTVSAVLGHAQTSTTLNIYAHSFATAQAAAIEAVANAIELKKNGA